jgi:hypothetical protein
VRCAHDWLMVVECALDCHAGMVQENCLGQHLHSCRPNATLNLNRW